MVIVKKSSPKNLSADCRSTVGRQSADCCPTVGRQSANCRPTVGQQLADCRPAVGQQFVLCLRPKCRPTVGLVIRCILVNFRKFSYHVHLYCNSVVQNTVIADIHSLVNMSQKKLAQICIISEYFGYEIFWP